MEFANVGKHCEAGDCNIKDFLPFTCKACSKSFCLDHRAFKDHNCSEESKTERIATVCSPCDASLPVCDSETAKKKKRATINNKACDHPKCKTKDILNFDCRDCGKKFCLKHRSQVKHKCSSLERRQHQRHTAGRPGMARNLGHSRLVQAAA